MFEKYIITVSRVLKACKLNILNRTKKIELLFILLARTQNRIGNI